MKPFWIAFACAAAAVLSAGGVVSGALGGWTAGVSFAVGAALGAVAIALVGLSAASYVQTGLRASRGEGLGSGKFLRAGLLMGRLLVVGFGLALALSWRQLDLTAFVAGLGTAPLTLAFAALRASR